uniref:Uncharacterized protein n=1 Tax=Arundo donax TaxID=35708 RepID=A0A0A9GC32_ARUDO
MDTGTGSVDIGSLASLSVPTQLALKPSHNLYYVNSTPLLYCFPLSRGLEKPVFCFCGVR